jgi:hypothetical protein
MTKKIMLDPKAMTKAIPTDINIPYEPNAIRMNGRINLATLKIIFFISTYFDERYAIKTFSDIVFNEQKTINNINSKEKMIFSLTNNNFGENVFRKIR